MQLGHSLDEMKNGWPASISIAVIGTGKQSHSLGTASYTGRLAHQFAM